MHRSRLLIRVGVLAVTLVMTSSCVAFTEPVAVNPGERIDLTPFLGTWHEESGSSGAVEFSAAGEHTFVGAIGPWGSDGVDASIGVTVSLTTIDGRIVASAQYDYGKWYSESEDPFWGVGTVAFEDDGDIMVVSGLDASTVDMALESGEIVGQSEREEEGYGDYGAVMARVDGADLRAYLRDHPEAFTSDRDLVLMRGEPDIPSRDELPPAAPGYPYPGYAPAQRPTTSYLPYGQASPVPMQVAPRVAVSPVPFPATPRVGGAGALSTGTGGSGGGGEPHLVRRLLGALTVVLFVGLAAVFAVDYMRRRERARTALLVAPVADGDAYDETAYGRSVGTPYLESLGRYAWPALLILMVSVGPIMFVTVMLSGLAFPSWVPAAQLGVQNTLHDFAPYLLAFSFGTMVGLAEIVNAYPSFSWEALSTKWATLLVLFNALGTSIAYAIVTAYSSGIDHPLLRTFGIAAGFAIVIRTRFVLARDLRGRDGDGGVSLNLGWMYAKIQRLCRQRIESDMLRSLRCATFRLLEISPDIESLQRLAAHTIQERAPSESDDLSARLEAILLADVPESIVRARVASFIALTGGREHVRFLLEHSSPPESA